MQKEMKINQLSKCSFFKVADNGLVYGKLGINELKIINYARK